MVGQVMAEKVVSGEVRDEQERLMMRHNRPRRLAHIVRSPINTIQTDMKIVLLQIIYVNLFTELDLIYPYTHLTKFYELVGTLEASEAEEEEEAVLMRLFHHSLINKAKDWYLDQPIKIMTN